MSDPVAEFLRLHSSGCFVMPNPWDVGSARALEQLGFKALATTSAGLAWTLGRADTQVTRDQALDHLRQIADAVTVPVNADFEDGYASEPAQVAENVKMAADTGIAGLSIEDASGDAAEPLYQFELALARVAAARRAIDESGTGLVLTARSEGFVCGRPDIDETIQRLRAYADVGADCLYAPPDQPARPRHRRRGRGLTETDQSPDQHSVHDRGGGGATGSTTDQRGGHTGAYRVGWVP